MLIHGASGDERMFAKLDPRVKRIVVENLVAEISPIKDLLAFREIAAILKRIRPDIVHTHTSKAGFLGRAAARFVGIRGVVHGVHIAPFLNVGTVQRMIYLAAEKAAARWTHAFISVSRGMQDAFLTEGLGKPADHHVIYSGMDLEAFRRPKPADDWPDLLGVPAHEPKPPVILMLAAFESRKRHAELIKAFDTVLAAVPEARLLLGGDGIGRAAVEAARAASSNPDRIRLAGFYPNPGGLIDLADLCVHCSTREGLPRVVVQYIAAGVPVVMTRLPGIEEIIHDGDNGMVFEEDDFTGLADAMTRLLTDRAMLERMTAAAAATDVSAWDVNRMCRDNHQIYDAVLAAAR